MNTLNKFALLVLGLLALSAFAFALQPAEADSKRFVLRNSQPVPQACQVVKKLSRVSVVSCPASLGKTLSLTEDLRVHSMDSASNTQIFADRVHSRGLTGSGRTVAVLDTGVQCGHPELRDSCVSGWDFVNGDADASDDNGHGTHVAGIITANGLNSRSKGVAPGAVVKAYKVLDAGGSGFFSDVIEAIYAAADSPEVDVISMSLGTSFPFVWRDSNCDGVFAEFESAAAYALSKGKLLVAAAGNSGFAGVSFPGCLSKMIAVGAVTSRDVFASFSSWGFGMKDHGVAAPGVGIYSTWLGGGYATLSGTSMATPMVSALAALAKQKNPSLSPQSIKAKIFSTSKDLGSRGADFSYGAGRINALACVLAS